MKIYAYVPGQDRSWIRRCDVPSEELHKLTGTTRWFTIEDLNQPVVTLDADEVSVALDWLDERDDLPPALGGRLRRETRVRRWLLYRSGELPRELLVRRRRATHGARSYQTWRETFRPYLQAVLVQLEGQEKKHQDQALREAFPAGPRKHHPYKTWLDEIRVLRGLRPPQQTARKWGETAPQTRQDHPAQAVLFGGAP